MNTETENSGKKLQGAFGDRGTNVNAIAYGHPHADKIIEEAREIISESKTGAKLLRVLNQHMVPFQIMKGSGESGFSPDMMSITLLVPGKVSKATGPFIIDFIRAMRDAAQELGGMKTPDPSKDLLHYAAFIHARNVDSLNEACKIVKELTNSSHFPVLLDSLKRLGFNSFYNAYLEGKPIDELYDYYAEAYDKTLEGVI